MSGFNWQFPRNEAHEIEGPNDSGLTHFRSNPEESIIRESIQNSLDAREAEAGPVLVSFEVKPVPTSEFAADSLASSLDASIKSPHNDEAHSEHFKRGVNRLRRERGGSINCLQIIDSNTTGAEDVLRPNGAPSKWQALTKGSGASFKEQKDAAGSFGLGKFAAFAATNLRTVLYSTAWNVNGTRHHRFQGKTILVSHKDTNGLWLHSAGYLGAPDFRPLCDDSVPRMFRMRHPGTALYIPGYEANRDWQNTTVSTVIKHFFHAIIHEHLEVKVDAQRVNAKTINTYVSQTDKQTSNFVRVSQTDPIVETDIPGIGHVTLRIEVSDDLSDRTREIALVRDAGMMITNNMRLRGLGRLPSHWRGFTVIVECLSHGESSLLRDAESPRHDDISTGYIPDPDRQKEAEQRFEELGRWCYDRIRERAEIQSSEDTENANELAKYLELPGAEGENADNRPDGSQGEIVTIPIQSNRAPIRSRRSSGTRARREVLGQGKDDFKRTEGTDKERRSNQPRRRGVANVSTQFVGLRFQPGLQSPTHSVTVAFDNPGQALQDIKLVAIGEDGQDVDMGVREAVVNGNSLAVINDTVRSLNGNDAERWVVEFVTTVPVANKTFYLKGVTQKDEIRS